MSISRNRPPSLSGNKRTIRPRSPAEALEPTRAPERPGGSRTRREGRPVGGFVRFVSGVLTAALMAMALVGGAFFLLDYQYNAAGPLESAHAVTIRSGEGRLAIAAKLQEAGVIRNRQLFVFNHFARNTVRRFSGKSWRDLKAGEYEFKPGASMRSVLEAVTVGRTVQFRVTIPEGFTSQQVVKRVMEMADMSGEVTEVPLEGSLLPDTYSFSRGTSRMDVLRRMSAGQKKLVAELWEGRAADLPIATIDEAIILASIVEKETGQNSERGLVAGVFINRLRKGMRLQSDPTIIYGIVGGAGSLGRPIYRSDIKKKTPYNTYHIKGLPPTAICNPGREAIAAVLQPVVSDNLYFVADGTGGHKFSATLKEHNSAVANWRKIEKEARAKAVMASKAAAKKNGDGASGEPGDGKVKAVQAAKDGGEAVDNAGAALGVVASANVSVAGESAKAVAVVNSKEGGEGAGSSDIPLPVRKPR